MQGGRKENHMMTFVIAGVLVMVIAAFVLVFVNQMVGSMNDLYINDTKFQATTVKSDQTQTSSWPLQDINANQALIAEFANTGLWKVSTGELKGSVDVLWLSSDKAVIYKMSDVSSGDTRSLVPNSPAKYVVELSSGVIKKQSIRLSQMVVF